MRSLLTAVFSLYLLISHAQERNADSVINIPGKYIGSVDDKVQFLDKQLTRQTEKYLNSLSKQEMQLKKHLSKIDSSKAAEIFGDVKKNYENLSDKLNNATGKFDKLTSGEFMAGLDSVQGSLAFLKDAANIVSKTKDIRQKLGNSLNQANQLQHKLKEAGDIQSYLQSRQQQIRELLSQYTDLPKSVSKCFGKYQQQAYYYSQTLREYKQLLNDPDKLVRKTLEALQHIPAFSKFFSRYSMLASLFPAPDNYGTPQALVGLQTRSGVQQLMQQQLALPATGGANASPAGYLQQQMQQAQGELSKLKDKLNQLGINGGGSSDMAMPESKINPEKTKSVWKRIRLGTNISTQRSNQYYPNRMAIAVTAAYKLSAKTQAGVGLSAAIGLGQSWKHIRLTGESIGTRAFIDWKAPDLFRTNSRFMASLWFTAGAELNYNRTIESLAVFKNYSNWTKSALAGLTKKYSMNSPLKKGKKVEGAMSLSYDFLYSRHVPPTPAVVWRVGWGL
ncbi:hypothetical protein DC498_20955 [Terrimonas sp.]|uniref:hypothetical protein n=1 Tax=Terrimonas sp. TaxID=1914338 RepID=UPI000D508EA0|nr:hypothetical protein [Terrimonas sp.]PVD50198.1 hypothetical protein DC498_20955 [Terrimonas sp.]